MGIMSPSAASDPAPGRATSDPVAEITDAAAVTEVHRRIIVPSFPAEERGTAEELVARVGLGHARVHAAGGPGAWTAAAITETFEPGSGIVLLSWLAVAPGGRSAGLGGRVLRVAVEAAYDDGARIVLAEIEPEGTRPALPEHGDPDARRRFYARHGAQGLDLPHAQPAAGPGLAPIELDLIALPAPGHRLPATFEAGSLEAFLAAYRRPAPSDQHWAATRDALARGPVPLRPLSR